MADNDLNRFLKRRAGEDDSDPRETRPCSSKDYEVREVYEDEYGREHIELPERGASVAEVYELRQELKEHEAEARKEQQAAEREQTRAEQLRRISDPFDAAAVEKQAVESMTTESQQWEQRRNALNHEIERRTREAQAVYARDPLEGQIMMDRVRQDPALRGEWDAVAAKEAELMKRVGDMRTYSQQRQVQAERNDLFEAAPALATDEGRAEFTEWLRSQGATTRMLENERDPGVYIKAYKKWQSEKSATAAAAKKKRIAATAFTYKGAGAEPDSQAAREALRETGSTTSALRYLQTKKLERRS